MHMETGQNIRKQEQMEREKNPNTNKFKK